MIYVSFIKMGTKGRAIYDPSDESYSWEYEGSDPEIENILSFLESGKVYTKINTLPVESDDDEPTDKSEVLERPVYGDWSYQMKQLAQSLSRKGFQTDYIKNNS